MFFINFFKKKVIMELHHDLKIESRITRFLVKKLKYLNSKYVKKIVAITDGVKKKEYVNNDIVSSNKILVLPSGSSIIIKYIKKKKKSFFKIGYFWFII